MTLTLVNNLYKISVLNIIKNRNSFIGYPKKNCGSLYKYFNLNCASFCTEKVDNLGSQNTSFSNDEIVKILNVINNSDQKQLSKFSISKGRLERLLVERVERGGFKSLDAIVGLKGFNASAVQKMCQCILGAESGCNVVKVKGKLYEPLMDEKQKNNVRSVCSLMIDFNYTCWALIERGSHQVTCWNIHRYRELEAKQLKTSNIMEMVWSMCQQLPRSDAYIIESLPTAHRATGADKNNPKAAYINLQRVQLISMMVATINSLENAIISRLNVSEDGFNESFNLSPFVDKVFYLRPLLSSRLFKTFVGSERISSQSVVESMISNTSQEKGVLGSIHKDVLCNLSPVNFNNDCQVRFFKANPTDRETLSQTLLLGITFIELCLSNNLDAMKLLMYK